MARIVMKQKNNVQQFDFKSISHWNIKNVFFFCVIFGKKKSGDYSLDSFLRKSNLPILSKSGFDRISACVSMKKILASIMLVASAMVFLLPSFALASRISVSIPVNNIGLLGRWTFDGINFATGANNVKDVSGNGNHGTLTSINSGPMPSTVAGKMGQAIKFNSAKDNTVVGGWVRVSNPTAFDVGTGDFTISAWYKTRGEGVESLQTIVQKDLSGSGNGLIFLLRNSGNGGYLSGYVGGTAVWGSQVIVDDTWHHVIMLRQSGEVKYYVDGNYDAGGTASGNTNVASETFDIGYTPSGPWWGLGAIDDLRFYNRALSVTEIKHLYNSGGNKIASTPREQSGTGLSAGLVGHWTFDGSDMRTNISDKSGQGNNGYLFNLTKATSTALGSGMRGQALRLDGSSTWYGKVSDHASLRPTSVTASAWVKIENGSDAMFIAKDHNTSAFAFALRSSGGNFQFYSDGGSVLASNAPYIGKWVHLTGVFDANCYYLYINGELSNSSCGPLPALDYTGNLPLYLGGYSTSYVFKGGLDDARVYNRALSANEIKQLYAQGGNKIAITPRGQSADGLSAGLVGHWTFDGKDMLSNVVDRSGSGYHGWLVGFTSTTTTAGRMGQAMSFNGATSYVQMATSTPIFPFATGNFSATAWIKTNSLNSTVLAKTVPFLANNGFSIMIDAYGKIRGWIYNEYIDSATIVNDGKWHHVVFQRNSVSTTTLYIDGNLDKTAGHYLGSQSAGNGSQVGKFSIGMLLDGSTPVYPFPGSIDDVRIYDRAITASEAKQLYNLGR